MPAHLQSQWDADRARKAEHKRLRAEARLAAQLDPYASSSKKSRNKGKKHQRGQMLALPDSDDDENDDEESDGEGEEGSDGGWGGKRRKEQRKSDRKGGIVDLRSLDDEIRVFLQDQGKTTMSLPPMDKSSRKKVRGSPLRPLSFLLSLGTVD